jgi:hypothetical protein
VGAVNFQKALRRGKKDTVTSKTRHIRISDDLWGRMQTQATAEGVKVSEMVRERFDDRQDTPWSRLQTQATAAGVRVQDYLGQILRANQIPEWETPAHEEVDLSKATPEDLGLDPYDYSDSLVRAIYRAQLEAAA